MDAIALLCNLHADGPVTKRHLARIGCLTLADLATRSPLELERAIGCAAPRAERFLREARALRERIGNEDLDAATARGPVARDAVVPEPARALPEYTLIPHAPVLPAGATEHSLRAERAFDTGGPPPTTTGGPPPIRTYATTGRTALVPGLFPGLDDVWSEGLFGQGITTIEALTNAPGFGLARALGRSLSKLMDLQFAAHRYLREQDAANPATAPILGTIMSRTADSAPMVSIEHGSQARTEETDSKVGGPFV